jgi:hypothetical protein
MFLLNYIVINHTIEHENQRQSIRSKYVYQIKKKWAYKPTGWLCSGGRRRGSYLAIKKKMGLH